MANVTPNFRLHQWEPTDPFLRTDFNQDLSAIDTVLGRLARGAEDSAYNVYNLMLQNDYEGKYTGYRKALLFDGFTDTGGIQSLSAGLYHNEEKCRLEMTNQTAYATPGGVYDSYTVPARTSDTYDLVFPFGGVLTSISLYCTGGIGLLSLLDGEESLTGECERGDRLYDYYTTYPMSATVRPGHVYTLVFRNDDPGSTQIRLNSNQEWLWKADFAPQAETQGQLTTVDCPLELEAGRQVAVWARWSGSDLTCALSVDGGEPVPLEQIQDRESADLLNGGAVTEREFRLPELSVPCSRLALSFTLDRGAGAEATLYDYGLVAR